MHETDKPEPGIETYVIQQGRVRDVARAVEDRCLRNFVKHGQQILPDGTSGDGSWADATLYLLIDAHRTEHLPDLRWTLIKLGARVTEWIADIDRRRSNAQRVTTDVPVIPGDVDS